MFELIYLDRFDIKDKDAGLTEPSGLALGHDGKGLWTVSDDTKTLFYMGFDGRLKEQPRLNVPDDGLEGFTVDGAGKSLYSVREDDNSVIRIKLASREVADRRPLSSMGGYGAIERFFAGSDKNKGLEGIAWNSDRGTLAALKEGEPGLLVEIGANLRWIRGYSKLTAAKGFVSTRKKEPKVDFSGICYDAARKAYWIVSDKARRLYLYDPALDRVRDSAALAYKKGGKRKTIEKAEGVAYDPATGRLYVVSDEEARLYVFEVQA
ncbi:MAG: SdiA-regulated domain-containing protein [Pseudomonadota bacterium]